MIDVPIVACVIDLPDRPIIIVAPEGIVVFGIEHIIATASVKSVGAALADEAIGAGSSGNRVVAVRPNQYAVTRYNRHDTLPQHAVQTRTSPPPTSGGAAGLTSTGTFPRSRFGSDDEAFPTGKFLSIRPLNLNGL